MSKPAAKEALKGKGEKIFPLPLLFKPKELKK
jgi:hypothetical protein